MFNKKSLIIGISLIVVVMIAVFLVYPSFIKENNGKVMPRDDNISIKERYDTRIVYTLDVDQSTEKYIEHCDSLGGEFNSCGSSCAPDAELCASVCAFTCEDILVEDKNSTMNEYKNYRYSVSIKYPSKDWVVNSEESLANTPLLNIYKESEIAPDDLPIDHFANVAHVSIYPKGIPTEGISAQMADFNLEIEGISKEDSRLYTLEDGTVFAAMLKPVETPESWNDAGFIWARAEIGNMETQCLSDGEIVDSSDCNPLGSNDQIMLTGTVDDTVWQKEIDIMKSIRFLDNNQDDLVYLEYPLAGDQIEEPLKISGQARGEWFFEASFPIVLTNWDGEIIAEASALTTNSWMTEDYVPFSLELEFDNPYSEGDPDFMKSGSLILQKANPSGLPENDNALEIRVEFQ